LTSAHWRVRLSEEAEQDFEQILENTLQSFGERQLVIYRATLVEALAQDNGLNVAKLDVAEVRTPATPSASDDGLAGLECWVNI